MTRTFRPHDGFLQMAKPYITAFHAGSKTVDSHIESEQLIYWYRPTLKSASCDSTDTCQQPWSGPTPNPNYFPGKPNGYDTMEDSVFVVALLHSPGTVTIASGSNKPQAFNAPAGASSWQVDMGTGKQTFSLTRNGQTVLGGDSLRDIAGECVCGIYNFNAYVGTLPAGAADPLEADGLMSFTNSLSATCQPTPSLGAASGNIAASTPVNNNPSASSLPADPQNPPSSSRNGNLQTPTTNVAETPFSQGSASSPSPTVAVPTSQTPTITTAGVEIGASETITALSQLVPTNCMRAGAVWAGPTGSDPPAGCDGG